MPIMKKRKIIRLFYILVAFVLLFHFVSFLSAENKKISKTWNINFPLSTPLEEPREILYSYSTRGGFHGDGIDIHLMDVSNWNMQMALDNFPVHKNFSNHQEIEIYCKDNLHFLEEDSEALSEILCEVFAENSIWVELHSKSENVLAMYYNQESQRCLLIASYI